MQILIICCFTFFDFLKKIMQIIYPTIPLMSITVMYARKYANSFRLFFSEDFDLINFYQLFLTLILKP
jgi:hypothetical protein